MIKLITFFLLLHGSNIEAKLLDKVVAVIDDEIITLSQVERIKNNINGRKEISPQIYNKSNYDINELVKIIIHSRLIREKLSTLGYIISDDQVESQIKNTEKRLGLTRDNLLTFLRSNKTTFEEYFELTREAIEFNIFASRVIQPLISITEQEIKNEFYKKNSSNASLSFKYTLVDFSLAKSKMKKNMLKNFKKVLGNFQNSGNIPSNYSSVETNILGDISEDGLTNKLNKLLKKTNEGSFSKPILISDSYHVFFVKKKDLVESSLFVKQKESIKRSLYEKVSNQITSLWFQRESNKHYIKYFL